MKPYPVSNDELKIRRQIKRGKITLDGSHAWIGPIAKRTTTISNGHLVIELPWCEVKRIFFHKNGEFHSSNTNRK